MEQPDARALLLGMHRGQEPAAEMLWALFAPRLTAYARVLLPSGLESAAEDVVQGVFVKVLGMRRAKLRAVRDAGAFLFRVTRNEAINHGRGELREKARQHAAQRSVSHGPFDPGVARVLTAIERLPFEQREVLLLRYVGGLTIGQVGEALGVNRNTVASRGRLGLGRLREMMGADVSEVCDE